MRILYLTFIVSCLTLLPGQYAKAEYGDVIINNYSSDAGVNPVIFPHWFHRIRFTCKVCHHDLGFHFKVGEDKIKMLDIINGRFCGKCHNGEIAWGIEKCDLCHSGNKMANTQGSNSPQSKLLKMKQSQKKTPTGK